MKKIALYGGAFDPPHHGHIGIIQSLCKAALINEVWLLPCGDRQDKQLLLPAKLRFDLMKNIFKESKQIRVSEEQIEMSKQKGGQIHTYDLLNQFKNKQQGTQFYFVIGADILHSIHTWGKAQSLVKQHNFIVFNRKGYQLDSSKLPQNAVVIENQDIEISSTYIKNVIRDQGITSAQKIELLRPWIPQLAINTLIQHKLI